MRVAAIDIGTNTVLLLVAERRPDGSLVAIEERATITRLGEGVDRTRALSPEAIARTCTCLSDYAAVVRSAGVAVDRIAVVGTSAMRDAHGGDAVRDHVARVLGVDARVISGDDEARITFAGALSGLGLPPGDVTVFDIGGGSTEVVHGALDPRGMPGAIAFAHSFDVGSVRLTERHIHGDPPTEEERAAIDAYLDQVFANIPARPNGAHAAVVGIAGTVTTLAAVALRMEKYDGARVHGHRMTRAELDRVTFDLARLPLGERRRLPGMEPKRADVIVAGALIVQALVRRLDAHVVTVSDRGVRWGLASELAGTPDA